MVGAAFPFSQVTIEKTFSFFSSSFWFSMPRVQA